MRTQFFPNVQTVKGIASYLPHVIISSLGFNYYLFFMGNFKYWKIVLSFIPKNYLLRILKVLV